VFDNDTLPRVRAAIRHQTTSDRPLLDALLEEVRELTPSVKPIRPRSTTAVSLVASDGGNNQLVFDPFYVQLVLVVDSYGKQLFLDVISLTTDTDELSARQFNEDGSPRTPLGRMMSDLGVGTINGLTPMIHDGSRARDHPEDVKPSWVLTYRDLCEWAVLYDRVCRGAFATDTLLVRDGFLRTKIFRDELFIELGRRFQEAIDHVYREDRRRVFLVGLAKHSQVLTRYRLAMAIEGTLGPGEARYVHVPREFEARAYRWPEYARGAEAEGGGEAPKFVLGDMYFVRFGKNAIDPVWAVDIYQPQAAMASEIFGYLLADAIDGFPVPFYPRCLQRAHEFAQVVDLDLAILQDEVFRAVKDLLPSGKGDVVEALRLTPDVANRRYE
jgi:hypothetical protein